MSFYHPISTQTLSRDWCVDIGGGENRLDPTLLSMSDFGEARQDLGQDSLYAGFDPLFPSMPEGLCPYLEDYAYHHDTQASAVVGHTFGNNHCIPWHASADTGSRTMSSGLALDPLPDNSQSVQPLFVPSTGGQYICQAHHGGPAPCGPSWSTSSYDGHGSALPTMRDVKDVHPSLPEAGQSSHHPSRAKPATDAECIIQCPHGCGTTLTGNHALGNLTRHLKTRACAGSGRARTRYHCPIEGCSRVYSRTDGLKVHMRRRHGAP